MFISLAVPFKEAIELNGELIVYSRKDASYIGVGGAGRLLLETLEKYQEEVSPEILFARALGGAEPSTSERAILEEALRTLVEEGLCNDRS